MAELLKTEADYIFYTVAIKNEESFQNLDFFRLDWFECEGKWCRQNSKGQLMMILGPRHLQVYDPTLENPIDFWA